MKNQQQKIKATDKGTVACLKFTHWWHCLHLQ